MLKKKSSWEHNCLGKHWKRIKFTLWVRDDRKWAAAHDWKWREAPPTATFPGWRSTPLPRSVAPRLLDKLIFLADLYCPLLWCKEFLMMRRCQRRWSPHTIILQSAEWQRTVLMLSGGPTRQNEHLLMTWIPAWSWTGQVCLGTGVIMQKEALSVRKNHLIHFRFSPKRQNNWSSVSIFDVWFISIICFWSTVRNVCDTKCPRQGFKISSILPHTLCWCYC